MNDQLRESTLDLNDLWALLEGRAAPDFEAMQGQAKMMKIALDVGPTDISIRRDRFTMQWKGRGRSTYWPKLAPPVTAELMRRAGLARVATDTVAWMPSAPVPGSSGLPTFEPPSYVVWFVRHEDGLDIFTREVPQQGPPPTGPIPTDGPHRLPEPWSSPVWRTYRDFPGGVACPHCHDTSTRFRALAHGALVCPRCGRSLEG